MVHQQKSTDLQNQLCSLICFCRNHPTTSSPQRETHMWRWQTLLHGHDSTVTSGEIFITDQITNHHNRQGRVWTRKTISEVEVSGTTVGTVGRKKKRRSRKRKEGTRSQKGKGKKSREKKKKRKEKLRELKKTDLATVPGRRRRKKLPNYI